MSLIRQVWALLIGAIVFATLGSVVVSTWGARAYLQTQLAMKNADNAQSLALTLSQQGGDAGLIELALAAQFDIGHYRSIRLQSPQGRLLFERVAPDAEPPAPGWFMRLVPLESAPGLAEVSAGGLSFELTGASLTRHRSAMLSLRHAATSRHGLKM